jgi:hypothetical protein
MAKPKTEDLRPYVKEDLTFEKPPEDGAFQELTASDADGWYRPIEGSWFQGRLLGRYEMNDGKGGKRGFYQVKVKKAAGRMITGKGDDAVEISINEGCILAFDERSALKVLQPQAESDGVYDCLITCHGKEDIKGGKTFWRFSTKVKCLKAPSRPLVTSSLDEIPF